MALSQIYRNIPIGENLDFTYIAIDYPIIIEDLKQLINISDIGFACHLFCILASVRDKGIFGESGIYNYETFKQLVKLK
ncbi:MAG: hypothetical protein VKN72_12235 [Nostocales cyanobacterium 94392]|nr:hypothetical protein [Nostocales cyanobacterium 94392]